MSAGIAVLTRALEPDGPERVALAELGWEALELPVLRFGPGPEVAALERRLAGPPARIAITSRHAAEQLAGVWERLPRAPGWEVVAVGESTAIPLRVHGHPVTLSPVAHAKGMAAWMLEHRDPGSGVLFLRGDRSLETLPSVLGACGVVVEELQVYRTDFVAVAVQPLQRALQSDRVRVSCFASPSAVEGLKRCCVTGLWRELLARPVLAAGETTAVALRGEGAGKVRTIPRPGPEGFAAALLEAGAAGRKKEGE